ncbi:hypothetical protein BaRGS_00027292, partial [Batillaria attramentaria]
METKPSLGSPARVISYKYQSGLILLLKYGICITSGFPDEILTAVTTRSKAGLTMEQNLAIRRPKLCVTNLSDPAFTRKKSLKEA